MPLIRRVPKFGFTNIDRVEYQEVNVETLDRLAKEQAFAGGVVTPELLYRLGVTRKKSAPVKILGNGDLTVALQITAHKVSASAQQKIEAAGGAVQIHG